MQKRFIFILILFMLPRFVMSAEHWQGSNYIMRAFMEIALKNEFDAEPANLRKWNKPVHIWLDFQIPANATGKTADKALHQKLIRMHIKQLAELTGQYIGFVSEASKANVKIVLTTANQWHAQIRKNVGDHVTPQILKAVCLAGIQTNHESEITSAVVIIPVDQAIRHRKLVTCIVEEITQIYGVAK